MLQLYSSNDSRVDYLNFGFLIDTNSERNSSDLGFNRLMDELLRHDFNHTRHGMAVVYLLLAGNRFC